jgi:hypothetical protein
MRKAAVWFRVPARQCSSRGAQCTYRSASRAVCRAAAAVGCKLQARLHVADRRMHVHMSLRCIAIQLLLQCGALLSRRAVYLVVCTECHSIRFTLMCCAGTWKPAGVWGCVSTCAR